jgi:hypothetical protein
MIHHVSIPAREPERVAQVLTELICGNGYQTPEPRQPPVFCRPASRDEIISPP